MSYELLRSRMYLYVLGKRQIRATSVLDDNEIICSQMSESRVCVYQRLEPPVIDKRKRTMTTNP